jgi:hypothetical protein
MLRRFFSSAGFGWSWKFARTGYTKLVIKDPKALNDAQDIIFSNPIYQPKDDETFCNLATQDVLQRMGYGTLTGLTADEMYAYISTSKDWLIKPMADAIALVQEGTVLVAILPAIKLSQSHGHVNTLTPGSPDFSGRWDCKTPLCMNLGRVGTCFRAKGINWAFQVVPEIYALVATL